MYQAVDGRLIEVTTMAELSLGRLKGGSCRLIGCGRFIEVHFPILDYNYFGTLISGRLIELQL